MYKSRRLFRFFLALFLLTAVLLYAQEGIKEELLEEALEAIEAIIQTPDQKRIEMEIKTSTLTELAEWCRSLGLAEGGTSADLARRIREYFKMNEPAAQDGSDKRKVITIESARSTEYFKIEAIDEEYARLRGEVRISLKDGDAIHRITAWDILFNRTRNIITASGGVEYVKEEGEKVETFRGESITVDLDNWSSIFLGGVSERSLQSDNTTYLFAGTIISRDDEDVTTLNKATISSAGNAESLWSLSASRVWLLPGSDFAIYNAVLKVGEIPVLYIPFFYYPADEVIFHPVIGFRTREGNFVQTTTYILGRPKATSNTQSSSITRILGSSSDMEKRREGLFLRSTGKKAVDPSAVSLVAMVDYYANLGGYLGFDLSLPSKGILSAMDLTLGIGLTQTIAVVGGNYTPYFPTYDGDIDWNSSNLFSMEVPFRYRFKTSSSISGKYGSFSWNIPFYSDPLVDSDFLNRSEEMDWVNMIQQGAAMEAEITSQNYLGVYSWQFSGSINPKFPNMSPYITGISLSAISTNISFRTIDIRNRYGPSNIKYYSPSSFFFAPDTATLYSMSASMAGSPLSFGRSAAVQSAAAETKELPDSISSIGIPRSPFEERETPEAPRRDPADVLVPPVLNQRFDLPRAGSLRFSLDYRIAPSSATTLKFDSNNWKEYNEVDWGDVQSVITNFTGNADTTLNFSHSEGLFSSSFTYSFNGTWRQYSFLNEEASDYLDSSGQTDPDKVNRAKEQEYRQSNFTTSYILSTSFRPLLRSTMFGSSSLQYSLRGLAAKSNFTGTGDNPEWETLFGEWNKEKIDTHSFSGNISATVMEKSQTFSITADLPPKDSALSFSTSFRIWVTETSANMRVLFPGEDDKRKLEPFNATERINFGTYGTFSQSLTLDTQERELTSLTSSLNLSKWGLTVSYAASRMQGYEYSTATAGWVQRTSDPSLQSRDLSMVYSKNFSKRDLFDGRMNFSVNTYTRLYFDLQRYTSSNLQFTLGFTLGISKFLDLTMSANSENAMIYRYFKDMPFFADAPIAIQDGPQNNFFLDLFDSFRFDDEELRKRSGFKMKSFRIAATHNLGDWNAILNWSMAPYRPPGSRQFEMNNEVSFLLQWIPISEIKSDISYSDQKIPNWQVR
ncbi:MAG: LPS-assembly protein LptD [Treponema sp.]|nr:LPS-assembly protein LptD [Treponema sp.]